MTRYEMLAACVAVFALAVMLAQAKPAKVHVPLDVQHTVWPTSVQEMEWLEAHEYRCSRVDGRVECVN